MAAPSAETTMDQSWSHVDECQVVGLAVVADGGDGGAEGVGTIDAAVAAAVFVARADCCCACWWPSVGWDLVRRL